MKFLQKDFQINLLKNTIELKYFLNGINIYKICLIASIKFKNLAFEKTAFYTIVFYF